MHKDTTVGDLYKYFVKTLQEYARRVHKYSDKALERYVRILLRETLIRSTMCKYTLANDLIKYTRFN